MELAALADMTIAEVRVGWIRSASSRSAAWMRLPVAIIAPALHFEPYLLRSRAGLLRQKIEADPSIARIIITEPG